MTPFSTKKYYFLILIKTTPTINSIYYIVIVIEIHIDMIVNSLFFSKHYKLPYVTINKRF